MKNKKDITKKVWFKRVRGSYLPCSTVGWLLYIPFVAYLLSTALAASQSTSLGGDFFYAIFPHWVSAAVVMHWIASNHSKV